MRFFYKEKKIRNGYITAFSLLMISYFLVFFIIHQMEKRALLVNHNNEVINNMDIMLSCLKDAESSFRGFVIIAEPVALENYHYHLICIQLSLLEMHRLFEGDPFQKKNLDTLVRKVESKKALLNLTISDLKKNLIPEPEVLSGRIRQGTTIMQDISNLVFRMQTYESEKLAKRTGEFESITKTLKIVHFSTFFIALFLVIYSMVVFNNLNISKRQYRAQLEEGIEKLKIANNDLQNLRSTEKFATSGRIARAIAHEIRNPLTSISLAAEQLSPAVKEDAMLLEMIIRNVKRIHNLITELLNSTKFSQLNLSTMSLNTLVDQTLDLARDRLELNNIKVIKNISPNQCAIDADKDKLVIALLNLVINAIEAMEPGKGVLEITTIRKNGKCYVAIRDNGTGMNESSISRIFEPYFTQKENGSGLGLTLTQNIILNHKGNIYIESKPHKGTIFTIELNHAG